MTNTHDGLTLSQRTERRRERLWSWVGVGLLMLSAAGTLGSLWAILY